MGMDDDYKIFRLINGEETREFTSSEEFKEEVAEMILNCSRIELSIREGGANDLIVEVL